MITSVLKIINGIVKVRGNTDNTLIGNNGDRLKTDAIMIGAIDSGNTTTSNLGVSGVFTGTFLDLLTYNNIVITVLSDKASATNGFVIQWSNNGSTVHATDVFNIAANSGKQFSFGRLARYFRVVYTNGIVAQTSFSLQTILCSGNIKPSSHRIIDAISDEDDSELVKAVLTGRTTGGVYKNVIVDANGNMLTALAPGGTVVPTLGTNLVYEDMNAGTGGVARTTAITVAGGWTKVYEYSAGAGLLLGLKASVEDLTGTLTNFWTLRLVVDSAEIFTATGINLFDMVSSGIYNWNTGTTPSPTWAGLNIVQDTFSWDSPAGLPLTFNSSVKVYVKRNGTTTKNFRAGLVALVKS